MGSPTPGDSLSGFFERLVVEFGAAGQRAVGFLLTAGQLLESTVDAPRLAETAAYALREALIAIPSIKSKDEGPLRSVYAGVQQAREGLEHAQGLSGEDQEEAQRALLQALDQLDDYLTRNQLHQRRLIEVIVERSGVRPVRGAGDVVDQYQRLLSEVQGKEDSTAAST